MDRDVTQRITILFTLQHLHPFIKKVVMFWVSATFLSLRVQLRKKSRLELLFFEFLILYNYVLDSSEQSYFGQLES